MRVILVGPDNEDNLSIRYLSACLLQAGHLVELSAFNNREDMENVVRQSRGADIVGLSMCFQVRAREFLDLAAALKEDGCPLVVMGGHYATCAAQELMAHHAVIDIIVLHEGERTIAEIAAGTKWDDIPGIVYRQGTRIQRTAPRAALENLDELPFPDRRGTVHLFAGVPTAYLMGSRGCVASCDYCCIMTLHKQTRGKKYRTREPASVVAEMSELYHDRGIRQFIFHDDNFLVPSPSRNHARLDQYEAAFEQEGMKDIGFCIKCRPPDAERSVLQRLRDMGLLRVFLGIESSTAEGLRSIGRDQKVEQSEQALDLCLELGISGQYTMMMFHPDATLATIESDIDFMRRHSQHALNFCRTEIYAGTPLERRMSEEGRAHGNYLARTYTIADEPARRACHVALAVFHERCWSMGGLMERVIGLDHLAAVAGHFYRSPAVSAWQAEVRTFQQTVNRELVELLSDVVKPDLCVADLKVREAAGRAKLMGQLLSLYETMDAAILPSIGLVRAPDRRLILVRRFGHMARHAAAVALAFGAAGCINRWGVCEYAAPPLQKGGTGAVVPVDDRYGICEYAAPPLEPQVYKVQEGDTVSGIARKLGVDKKDIERANNLKNPDRIRVGQELTIPLPAER